VNACILTTRLVVFLPRLNFGKKGPERSAPAVKKSFVRRRNNVRRGEGEERRKPHPAKLDQII